MAFSDYIVYVDESGDHSLDPINPLFPFFVLSFCIFEKQEYAQQVVPRMKELKFKTFGHDLVILHEREIRKREGPFSRFDRESRENFLEELSQIINDVHFTVIAVVIDKVRLVERYSTPNNPYHLAMEYGLERVNRFINEREDGSKDVYFIFEARGRNEDRELQLEFLRVRDGANYFGKRLPFIIYFASKQVNSDGLQFADMTARPIGLSVMRPQQENRAMNILENKFYRNRYGEYRGFGLKVFP